MNSGAGLEGGYCVGTNQRLSVALLLALAIAGCQASPSSSPPRPTDGSTSPTATPSAIPAVTPAPSATQAPPATTAFGALTDSSGKGHLRLATALSSDGTPLAGASITVTTIALDKTYQVLTLKGVVPEGTKSVIIQLGFNQDGTGPGSADFKIYRITYADGGSGNRLPNGDFDSGLYRWAAYGDGSVTTPKSDRGDGRMLRVKATPTQNVLINSYGIPGTPEAGYKMTIAAVVPPAGATTGHIAVIFLKKIEFWRETINLVAPPIDPVELTTDAAGAIGLDEALPAGRYAVRISYPGDATHAPAVIEQQVTVR